MLRTRIARWAAIAAMCVIALVSALVFGTLGWLWLLDSIGRP